jgi:hypothetical protein
LVREEAQKAIAEQHETENKEKEEAFDEINESIGLVEDRNTLKGESSLLPSDNAFSCEWPGYIFFLCSPEIEVTKALKTFQLAAKHGTFFGCGNKVRFEKKHRSALITILSTHFLHPFLSKPSSKYLYQVVCRFPPFQLPL